MQRSITSSNRFLWLAGAALLAAPAAQANEIVCPEFVSIAGAPVVSSVDKEWSVSSRDNQLWNDGGFVSSGKPEELGDLRGDEAVINGTKQVIWHLDESDNQRGIWFSCSYGKWHVLLSRKVQGHATTCWSSSGEKALPAKLICK